MKTYTTQEIKGADKTTLVSYSRAERTAFDTTQTYTVACSNCGLFSTRNRYKWVPVDFYADNPTYLCVEENVTEWTCAQCGPRNR